QVEVVAAMVETCQIALLELSNPMPVLLSLSPVDQVAYQIELELGRGVMAPVHQRRSRPITAASNKPGGDDIFLTQEFLFLERGTPTRNFPAVYARALITWPIPRAGLLGLR